MKTKFTKICVSFLMFFALTLSAYTQQITGTVSDENGVPLPGATVVLQGTSIGVSTDFDGNYSIEASQGDTLVFSFVGYATQSVTIGSSNSVSVQLQPDNTLDEVVVTALGVKRNTKALGYSVTEVDGTAISANPSTNAINALQGKVAGVMVTGSAMGAKGSSRVVIRGASSLTGNNQPLYVVDGITINNDNLGAAGTWGGTDFGDGISSINPDDVESISVLKGGAAAALYGSRASNGVIIITTKNGLGKEGLGIEVNSTTQFDFVNNDLWDPQTTYGSGRLGEVPANQAAALDDVYSAWGPVMNGQLVPGFDGVSRPYSYSGDNSDKFYRTGSTYSNTVSFSTGDEDGNTRYSITNLDNDDITPNSRLDRTSLGLNTNQKFGENISLNVNVKYVHEDQGGNPRLSDFPNNSNYSTKMYAPSVDVNLMKGPNENGTLDGVELQTNSGTFSQNPWFAAYNFINDSEKERLIGSANVRWDLTDFLYVRGQVGTDRYDYHRTISTPYGTRYQPLGSIGEYKLTFKQYDADIFLGTDNLAISDDVSLTGFVGLGSNYQQSESVSANGSDFIVPGLINVKNTAAQSNNYGFSEKKITSAFGSAELGFNDYAFLTVTARNDWFSTLSLAGKQAPNNDLYTSASFSLVLSDALDLGDTVSFLKVRAGISEVAGGADNPYALSLTYGIVGQGHMGASLGAITGGTIPNSEITPFEKEETEFGFDLRLFDNRLSLDATFYDNSTIGDIVGVSASSTSGFSSALANLGQIDNTGIELLLKVKPVVTDDFAMELSFNYTNNDSEVVATNDTGGNISMQEPRTRNLRVTHVVGERFGALFGTSFERDAQGRLIHEMNNGYPRPKINNSRKILGFGVAPQQLGIGASFRYKDFNAGFLVEGKSGGQIFSGTNALLHGAGLHKNTIPAGGREAGFVPDGVMEDGTPVTVSIPQSRQADYWQHWDNAAEAGIYDSDYFRMRQMSIGYDFPSSILEGTFIQSASVSLIGKNLFFISNSLDNIDPESAYNNSNSAGLEYFGMAVPRTIGVNVNLKF